MTATALYQSHLHSLPLVSRGKVRENYAVGQDRLLIVASDRISAYDVIMGEPIPGKGALLTQLALSWFERLSHIVPNHLVASPAPEAVVAPDEVAQVKGRAMLVKRLTPLPIEAVVRGYLAGSGWAEYRQHGAVCGVALPAGLGNASRLPEPIFTPATKAEAGAHDENISFEQTVALIGRARAEAVRDISLQLYTEAARHALSRGIVIADTKFEFGLDAAGTLTLMDEVLTPDSSRFWPLESYQGAAEQGRNPPSFDKQYLRDWLETATVNGQPWGKTAPAPTLPDEVIAATADRYRAAAAALMG
jgi:phosphoribosylaminoimidazole-succinocarboxamide synthase